MKQLVITTLDRTGMLEKAPQILATATFLFAGYGIGHIAATIVNALD
ncbi:hypothetical protein OAS19_03895 [Altererythrobacter sp.]|nr:hypothetical protein [Altererythrobacter sp.]